MNPASALRQEWSAACGNGSDGGVANSMAPDSATTAQIAQGSLDWWSVSGC